MEPARPQEMNHNHKTYWQKSQKWQCKDLLVNSNQGETWWNRLLWFGGADSNYFGSLWGRLMKCFFDELTVETKKEPEAPTGSQVVCVFFSHAFVCLSGWCLRAGKALPTPLADFTANALPALRALRAHKKQPDGGWKIAVRRRLECFNLQKVKGVIEHSISLYKAKMKLIVICRYDMQKLNLALFAQAEAETSLGQQVLDRCWNWKGANGCEPGENHPWGHEWNLPKCSYNLIVSRFWRWDSCDPGTPEGLLLLRCDCYTAWCGAEMMRQAASISNMPGTVVEFLLWFCLDILIILTGLNCAMVGWKFMSQGSRLFIYLFLLLCVLVLAALCVWLIWFYDKYIFLLFDIFLICSLIICLRHGSTENGLDLTWCWSSRICHTPWV